MVSLPSALEESVTDVTPQREDVGSKAFFMIDSLSSQNGHVVFNQRLTLCRLSQPCPSKYWDNPPYSCCPDVIVNHSRPGCCVLLKLMKLDLPLS